MVRMPQEINLKGQICFLLGEHVLLEKNVSVESCRWRHFTGINVLQLLHPRNVHVTLGCPTIEQSEGGGSSKVASGSNSTFCNVCEEWKAHRHWASKRAPTIVLRSPCVITEVVLCCADQNRE